MDAQRSAGWAVVTLLVLALGGGAVWLSRPTTALPEGTQHAGDRPASAITTSPAATDSSDLAAPIGDGGEVANNTTSCSTGDDHAPTGRLEVVPGESEPSGGDELTTYIVEVEEGLAVDPSCFAGEVDRILSDDRSWAGDGSMSMQRIDTGQVDFRVTLASPATTDDHCKPLETKGIFSCWTAEGRAMINVWRWEHGTEEYSDNLNAYREYVINHEVGHGLGHPHVTCTGPGDLAPVMQQQTKGLDGCLQNGWPLATER